MNNDSDVKCNRIMDTFLLLDKDEHIPLNVTAHLLVCRKCRSQVRLLTRAEHLSALPLSIETPLTDTKLKSIMKKVHAMKRDWQKDESVPNPISMKGWVISGILMIILMLTFALFSRNNSVLSLAFYLVFAMIITVYSALFIGSNIDFFIKKINTNNTAATMA